ncbi:MAG: ribbon-helix-helix protein, CopG family [Deltaproteobacteria bacterium]|nr:ribbon-helix-helix protein, CopG family [Deltaproteobacteria bacterium]MBI4373758.1 ribbon-helix-helix protein, CopG family [Deltaproteobacteria bacterium]
MKQSSVSFRVGSDKIESLDAIAEALDRDRSYVINEAISAYLEIYRWQIGHIKEGLRQADAGAFASEQEVVRVLKESSR